jgi:hypothetical protein
MLLGQPHAGKINYLQEVKNRILTNGPNHLQAKIYTSNYPEGVVKKYMLESFINKYHHADFHFQDLVTVNVLELSFESTQVTQSLQYLQINDASYFPQSHHKQLSFARFQVQAYDDDFVDLWAEPEYQTGFLIYDNSIKSGLIITEKD